MLGSCATRDKTTGAPAEQRDECAGLDHRYPALPFIQDGVMDESGTINPAALNTPCKLSLHRHCDATRRVRSPGRLSHITHKPCERLLRLSANLWTL